MKKKIILDCLGGDNGINAMVEGAVSGLKKYPELNMVLVGDEEYIKPKVQEFGSRVEIIHTIENISMQDHPTDAIRKKTNSSIVLGLSALKNREDCGLFLSAGSTGAVLTGGFLKVGRVPGVTRPAIGPEFPTVKGGKVMLIDSGANMDCKPINLIHFAIMGNEYYKSIGIKSPRIALLNVGVEDTKGNELAKETFGLLKKLDEKKVINFVGNVEGNTVLNGEVDVIVCDGFNGNVLLKSMEGLMKNIFRSLKGIMTDGIVAKIGALMLSGKLKKFKKLYMDNQTGTLLLGVKKPVVKMHGNSTADKVAKAIDYAISVIDFDLHDKMQSAIKEANQWVINEEA